MRHTISTLFAVGLTLAAQAYPVVSSDANNVELNVWNTGLTQAKAKAKALNRPILMVMLDTVNCGYSRAFVANIADKPAWRSFLEENPMILVFADKTKIASSLWSKYVPPFRDSTGILHFPTVALFRPDGSVADYFVARASLGSSPGFYNRVRNTTSQYPDTGTPPDPTGLSPSFAAPTPGQGEAVSAVLNGIVNIQAKATGSTPIAYSATGLPAGLSINTSTGLISGTPIIAGNSTVTVTARNNNGTATTSFTLRVTAQTTFSTGSYQGFFYDPDQTVRGTLTLSANASGALQAKVMRDGRTDTFKGTWQAGNAYAAELQSTAGGVLSVETDRFGFLTGSLGDTDLFGRLVNLADAEEFTGYYTSILSTTEAVPNDDEVDNQPEGSGYVTFTVSNRGTVRYAGVLADGTPFSGSSAIVTYSGTELADLGYSDADEDQNYALFTVYTPLYSRRGVIAAQIWIDGERSPTSEDNKVFIVGSQWVYPGKSATSDADGFAARLDDGAFTEIGAAFFKPENLAAVFEGTEFQTEDDSVTVQAKGASITLASGNALRATLTASTASGLFSGRFLYSPTDGTSPYTVTYKGVLIPALGIGGGYYLATDNSVPGYTFKRSKSVVIAP